MERNAGMSQRRREQRGRGLEARETGRGQHLKLDTGDNDENFMNQLDKVTIDLLEHFNNTCIFVRTSQMDLSTTAVPLDQVAGIRRLSPHPSEHCHKGHDTGDSGVTKLAIAMILGDNELGDNDAR